MMSKTFAHWVMTHRITSIVLVIMASLLLAMGGANPEFSANQRDSFRSTDSNLLNLIEIEEEFTSEKNVFVLIEPADKNIFSERSLNAIQQITDMGWTIPYSQRVESLTNHLYTQVENDDLVVEYLFTEDLTPAEASIRKQYALAKTGVRDYLINEEGNLALVSITINLPLKNSAEEGKETVNYAKDAVEEISKSFHDINFRVLGSVVMEVTMPEIVQKDSETVIPVAFFIVFLFMVIILRDLVSNIAAIVTCTLAIMAGMGAVLWTGVKLSPVLMNTPAIIIILGMADCIHLVVNYSQGLSKGLSKLQALENSIEINFKPIVFTSLTTAVSFLALNFSDSPPFAHMGNAAAIGIIFAMVASLTFLPAVLYYLPGKASGVSSLPKMTGVVSVYQQHGYKILSVFFAIIVGLALLIPNNKLDDNFIEWFDEDLQFRHDFDLLTQEIGGSVVVNMSIPAKSSGGVLEPEYLQLLEELNVFLSKQPEFMFSNSFVEIMKTLNKTLHADDPDWYIVPESRELASQYLLMYEMSLPFGQGLDNYLNFDRSKTRVVAVFGKLTDKHVIELESRLSRWLSGRQISDQKAVLASANIAFAHMQYSNINRLSKGFMVALFGISILLIVMLRSTSLGILSVIPNLVPAVMAFGAWALISGKVGFGVSIGITLTLGIVVDDTIHFLAKYQYARKYLQLSNEEAVRYAMDTVGVAMLLTTAMVAIAFGAMLTSSFTPNQDIALITIITVVFASLVDLILLPVIILKLFKDNPRLSIKGSESVVSEHSTV